MRKKHSKDLKNQNHIKSISLQEKSIIYQGPIPPPVILENYNKIIPGSAERILKLAEDQANHRIDMEKLVINSNIKNQNRGLIYGFIITTIAIIGGIICILKDKEVQGLTTILVPLALLAGIFITGKYYQSKEQKEKLKQLNKK